MNPKEMRKQKIAEYTGKNPDKLILDLIINSLFDEVDPTITTTAYPELFADGLTFTYTANPKGQSCLELIRTLTQIYDNELLTLTPGAEDNSLMVTYWNQEIFKHGNKLYGPLEDSLLETTSTST